MFIKTSDGWLYVTDELYVIGFGTDDTGCYLDEITCRKAIDPITGKVKLVCLDDGVVAVYDNVEQGYYYGRPARKPSKKDLRAARINDMAGYWFKSGPYKGKNRKLSRRMWPTPEILQEAEKCLPF